MKRRAPLPNLLRSLAAAAVGSLLAASCDPVHDTEVSSLGPDKTAKNEFHRAGQPCAACHGAGGPASTTFSVAGTIFSQPGDLVGVDNALVELTDSASTKYIATTNCVGSNAEDFTIGVAMFSK